MILKNYSGSNRYVKFLKTKCYATYGRTGPEGKGAGTAGD